MNAYRYADSVVHTVLELDELQAADGTSQEATHIHVRESTGGHIEAVASEWTELRHPQTQTVVLAVAKRPGGFVLRFPELVDFIVSDAGCTVEVVAMPACTRSVLRHLLLDQALPRLLAHRGRLVLHAGATAFGGGAVAFVGASGRGKSTLVASLSEAGWPALCDDALIVTPIRGGCSCLPLYSGLRLWPDSAAGLAVQAGVRHPTVGTPTKLRLPIPNGTQVEPTTLSAVFILEDEAREGSVPRVRASRLVRRDACVGMIRASFQLDLTNPVSAARTLQQAAQVARRTPVFALSFPREYSLLPEVHQVIQRHLQEAGAQQPGAPTVRGFS